MAVSTTATVSFRSAGLVSTLVFPNVANGVDLKQLLDEAREKKDALMYTEETNGSPSLIDASDIVKVQVVSFNIPTE